MSNTKGILAPERVHVVVPSTQTVFSNHRVKFPIGRGKSVEFTEAPGRCGWRCAVTLDGRTVEHTEGNLPADRAPDATIAREIFAAFSQPRSNAETKPARETGSQNVNPAIVHPKHKIDGRQFALMDALGIARAARCGGLPSDLDSLPSVVDAVDLLTKSILKNPEWMTGRIARQLLLHVTSGDSLEDAP